MGSTFPRIKHFTAGEYGEQNGRPHYHSIIFGLDPELHGRIIQETWGLGFTSLFPATAASIAYTAGYVAKKADYLTSDTRERVNPETGEVYEQQPAFFQMSNRPAIGAHLKDFWPNMRTEVIFDGHPMPVPRYYKEVWKKNTTPIDWLILRNELEAKRLAREESGNYTEARITAAMEIALAKRRQQSATRTL